MPQGTIKSFDHGSRSGSLVTDTMTELTYDTATFDASALAELRIGQRVRFEMDPADETRVTNLQLVSL